MFSDTKDVMGIMNVEGGKPKQKEKRVNPRKIKKGNFSSARAASPASDATAIDRLMGGVTELAPGQSREVAALTDTWAASELGLTTTLVPAVRPTEFKAKRGMPVPPTADRRPPTADRCPTALHSLPLVSALGGVLFVCRSENCALAKSADCE
jgi:hypothetical protein